MDDASKPSPWGQSARSQQRAGKRDAVLRTAARLFSERGYHGTSLELVAEELEITRPTVYYYFKNKDEILFECVRMSLQMIEKAASEVAKRGGSASDRLRAVMRQYAEVITMDFGMCLVRVGDIPLPPENRTKLRKMQSNIDRKFREIIAEGVADGSFTSCDPKFAAFAVAGALNSIARWYRPDGELGAGPIADKFVGILMSGLEARGAREDENDVHSRYSKVTKPPARKANSTRKRKAV